MGKYRFAFPNFVQKPCQMSIVLLSDLKNDDDRNIDFNFFSIHKISLLSR